MVKVTDRGPYSKRLMIDLSYKAAKELDIIRYGIAPVVVTPIKQIRIPYKPDDEFNPAEFLHLIIDESTHPLPLHR